MLEDGVVTEFYVERRDENQGVVGNLYKGRVMKVLPGMQSAFVDIGLERDAFLYVSDFAEFMEEEDEVDFREVGDEKRQGPRPDDRSRRGDRPRPDRFGTAVRPVPEPATGEPATERPVRFDDAVEQLAEIAVESVIPPPPAEEELPEQEQLAAEPASAQISIVERVTDDDVAATSEEPAAAAEGEQAAVVEPEKEGKKPRRGRGRKTAAEPASRKRGAKTEEKAAKPAARKGAAKPGTRRGRKSAEAEEEIEAVTEVEAEQTETEATQFHRITDEEVSQDAGDLLKDAIVQEKIIEQIHDAEYHAAPVEPETEWRVGSRRSFDDSGGFSFQRVSDESAVAATELSSEREEPTQTVEPFDDNKVSPFRHISDVVRGFYDRFQGGASNEQRDRSDEQPSSA